MIISFELATITFGYFFKDSENYYVPLFIYHLKSLVIDDPVPDDKSPKRRDKNYKNTQTNKVPVLLTDKGSIVNLNYDLTIPS